MYFFSTLLSLSVSVRGEQIGFETVHNIGWSVFADGNSFNVELPLSESVIDHINASFVDDKVTFTGQFHGLLHVTPDASASVNWLLQGSHVSYQLGRSDWLRDVLDQIGEPRRVLLEVVLPTAEADEPWQHALHLIHDAYRHYVSGNDAEVLQACYGAIDALPGAPQAIFTAIDDPKKREQADNLVRRAKEFCNAGRHVSRSGSQEGRFFADHRDAELAPNLTKLVVAYTSKVVTPSS